MEEDIVKLQMDEYVNLGKVRFPQRIINLVLQCCAEWSMESVKLQMGGGRDACCIFIVSMLCIAVHSGDKVAP
jgi:hypothetical protein